MSTSIRPLLLFFVSTRAFQSAVPILHVSNRIRRFFMPTVVVNSLEIILNNHADRPLPTIADRRKKRRRHRRHIQEFHSKCVKKNRLSRIFS